MSQVTTARTASKPAARPRLLGIVLRITDARGQADEYRVEVTAGADDGRPQHALIYRKTTGDRAAYAVTCDKDGTRSCECAGWLYRRGCKHVDSAAVLCRLFKPFGQTADAPAPRITRDQAEAVLFAPRPAAAARVVEKPAAQADAVLATAPGVTLTAGPAPVTQAGATAEV